MCKGTFNMFKNVRFFSQRGAMFGLDARIALSIFGALAVVSGYVGISKFRTAQDAAFFKEVLAIEEAMELMQTDLGVFYQFAIDNPNGANDIAALNDDTLIDAKYRDRWNGPYLDGLQTDHALYGDYNVLYRRPTGSAACLYNIDCFAVIRLTSVPAEVWERFNRMIDENGGSNVEGSPLTEGQVRSPNAIDPRTMLYYTSLVRRAD